MGFADRTEAGRRLATLLGAYSGQEVVVLGLPRGGVVVAAEVARSIGAKLDLAVAKKIGHPLNPEAAIGAVTEDGVRILDDRVGALIDADWLERETERKALEAAELRSLYTPGAPSELLFGRTAILVDDGIATGLTMMAAIESAKKRGASRVIVAVPVAPPEMIGKLKALADDVVVAEAPPHLYAVGARYDDFRQVDDDTVRRLLSNA